MFLDAKKHLKILFYVRKVLCDEKLQQNIIFCFYNQKQSLWEPKVVSHLD